MTAKMVLTLVFETILAFELVKAVRLGPEGSRIVTILSSKSRVYDFDNNFHSHAEKYELHGRTETSQSDSFVRFAKVNSKQIPSSYQEAKNFRSTQYLGKIKVGESQEFQVIFDTGSSIVVLNSVGCKDQLCVTKNKYDGHLSKTYRSYNRPLTLAMGNGIIKGKLSFDDLALAGLTFKQQDFIELQEPSKSLLYNTYFDGIVGLGLPGLAPKGTSSFTAKLKDKLMLPKAVFNFYFDRIQNYSQSLLSFGDPNLKFVKDRKLDYFPVLSKKYWAIRLTAVLIDDTDLGYCLRGCLAILDTGSSLIGAPPSAAYDIIGRTRRNCQKKLAFIPIAIILMVNCPD